MKQVREIVRIWIEAGDSWSQDRASRLGAGLAYYSLFALIPVLLLSVSFAGIFFGRDVAGTTVEEGISDLLGADIASALTKAIDAASSESTNSLLPLVSFGALLFSATLLFVAWLEMVAIIWDIPKETGIIGSLRRRLFGVAAVVGSGLVLALVIFAETVVGALDRLISPGALDVLLKIAGSLVPAMLGAVFLAVLFKLTPEVKIAWRSVALAAVTTIAMLSIGASAYGVYLGTVGTRSVTGVAGSLFLGLVLIYYSAQILLYGVEVSKISHTHRETVQRSSE